jgi:allantoicase
MTGANLFDELVDLASARLGGVVLAANDEFFAPKENLLLDAEPVWKEGVYTERGKWMDGWETRRRRQPGHDWCLIRLGLPGAVHGVVVDTSHFRGNYPERCALEGADLDSDPPATIGEPGAGDPRFRELLAWSPLEGHARNLFELSGGGRTTHLVFRIDPDGGVARLRVLGEVVPDWTRLASAEEAIDLAAVEHGGRVVAASDMFFGQRHHLIFPGPPRGMFDGWETKRRRGPGHDWAVVRLGAPGTIERVVVDTSYFKGNAPGACWLEGATEASYASDAPEWRELVARHGLSPDTVHELAVDARPSDPVRFVRFNIHPDGGVARLRLFGRAVMSGA